MYKGRIHFKKVMFEDDEHGWARGRRYAYKIFENQTYKEASKIASIIYNIYIQNLKNIALTYSYSYLTSDFIKQDKGDYVLNTSENKIYSSINLINDPKLIESEYNTSFRLINSLEENFKYYQPIIGVINCKANEVHNFKEPLILDGIHRFIALYELTRQGKKINPTLTIILNGDIENYCEMIIPAWLYDNFEKYNPLITNPSKSLNCITILDKFQIYENSDVWYKVKARNANIVVYLLITLSFIVDVFYSKYKKQELYLLPDSLIHNENELIIKGEV